VIIKLPANEKNLWFTQSIKKCAFRLGLKPRPFKHYLTIPTAAAIAGVSVGEFSYLILQDDRIKAFQTSTGEVFIHPDGVISILRNKGRKVTINEMRRAYKHHLRLENISGRNMSEEEKSASG